jgi:hypothetical protein
MPLALAILQLLVALAKDWPTIHPLVTTVLQKAASENRAPNAIEMAEIKAVSPEAHAIIESAVAQATPSMADIMRGGASA